MSMLSSLSYGGNTVVIANSSPIRHFLPKKKPTYWSYVSITLDLRGPFTANWFSFSGEATRKSRALRFTKDEMVGERGARGGARGGPEPGRVDNR